MRERALTVRLYEICQRYRGKIVEMKPVQAANDTEAVELARPLACDFHVEVWDAFRFVAHIRKGG
jgi:hypothetical protein